MRNSLAKLAITVLYFSIILWCVAPANSQTDSCRRLGGASSALTYWEDFCDVPPSDVYLYPGRPYTILCRGCIPDNPRSAPSFAKGGTASCSMYEKKMVIEFASSIPTVDACGLLA